MAKLPSGTVTFLFSDIESSTHLLRELGDRWEETLAAHNRILRGSFAKAGRTVRRHAHRRPTREDRGPGDAGQQQRDRRDGQRRERPRQPMMSPVDVQMHDRSFHVSAVAGTGGGTVRASEVRRLDLTT